MPADVESPEAVALKQKIDDQGTTVRKVKIEGAEKTVVDAAVQLLLKLKADYKELTGVDLAAGGSSKKSKKDKKAAAKDTQPTPPEPKKARKPQQAAAPAKKQSPAPERKTAAATAAPSKAAQPPAEARDMNMSAVLARLAQRSSQADQIVATLRSQISSLRQSAALTACKAEEERLRTENDSLKTQVEQLKSRLVQVEVKNGVPQVPLPPRSTTAAVQPPAVKQQPSVTAKQQPQDKQQAKDAGGKKEKKENKPKAAQQQKGGSEATVDISRIDMRIGKIVGVKQHPDADSLYLEEVDVGEGSNRTILSGLVKHIPIEQMQDRVAIFMCNLKPAKMRGIFSHGMIMCGSTPEKVEIIEPPAGAKVGDRLYVEGYEGTPDEQLNPKKKIFEQVQPDLRISPKGVATYKGVAWTVRGVEGLCTVPTMRDTPIK